MSEGSSDTDDCGFLGNRLSLRQFRRGHRAGTDAVLLAAAAPIRPGEHLLDAGAGVGAAALAVLARVPGVTGTLIERDPATAGLAAHNLAANGFAGADVIQADLFDREACRPAWTAGADVVISNPPFFEASRVRASADVRRQAAHVEDRPVAAWLTRLFACLRPKGRLAVIHRPDALLQLLAACEGHLGGVLVRPIHPRPGQAAVRVILTGILGSRAPVAIVPSLVLHEDDGSFTAEAQLLHRGAATLT